MAQFDEIIHQPVRLRLMAVLMTLGEETQMSFSAIKTALQITETVPRPLVCIFVGVRLRKEKRMISLSNTFFTRFLFIFVAVCFVLLLLAALFLGHVHLGEVPVLAQDTMAVVN